MSLVILTTCRSFFPFLFFLLVPFCSFAFSVNSNVSVCLLPARRLTRLGLRAGLCPTLLYPEDPETPETTKVTRRPLQAGVSLNKQQPGLMHPAPAVDYGNRSQDPSEWERTDLEVIMLAVIDLITCCCS